MEEIMIQSIDESIHCGLIKNALFLSERLYASSANEDNLFKIAQIYYQMGKINQCLLILQQYPQITMIKNLYLLALSNYDLGNIQEAESSIIKCCIYFEKYYQPNNNSKDKCNNSNKNNKNNNNNNNNNNNKNNNNNNEDEYYGIYSDILCEFDDIDDINSISYGFDSPCNIGSVYYLMGLISKKKNQKEKAIRYLKKSVYTYPFLWVAFEQLCNICPDEIDISDLFSHTNLIHQINHLNQQQQQQHQQYRQYLSNSLNQNKVNNSNNDNINNDSSKNNEQTTSSIATGTTNIITNTIKPNNFIKPPYHPNHRVGLTPSSFYDSSSIHITPINFKASIQQQHQQVQQQIQQQKYNNRYFVTPQTPLSHITPILSNRFSQNVVDPIPMVMDTPDSKGSQPASSSNSHTPYTPSTPSVHHHHHHHHKQQPHQHKKSAPQSQTIKKSISNEFDTPMSLDLKSPIFTTSTGSDIHGFTSTLKQQQTKQQTTTTTTTTTATTITDKEVSSTKTKKQVNFGKTEEFSLKSLSSSLSDDDYDEEKNENHHHHYNNKSIDELEIEEDDQLNITDNSVQPNFYEFDESSILDFDGGDLYEGLIELHKGQTQLLELFFILADSYRLLCLYLCKEAIESFKRLSEEQYRTGWVLTKVAKAYHELIDYKEARSIFQEVSQMEPYRLEGMELYSTLLWQMKEDAELSYIAHKYSEFDRLSPYSWVVVGNCFSLQRDHEAAIKLFRRAIQLDPDMTYAYTLCGHEYLANDELELALNAFRMAIRCDPRHYNAFYGIGLIYYRQEKYNLAEYHFRKALSINEFSSVLCCYLGMTLQHNPNKIQEGIDMLYRSIEIQPKNTFAKFKLAAFLFANQQYHHAIDQLLEFKEIEPKETPIYILLGKCYKQLGELDKALDSLNTALDLDPKNSNYIRSLIDKLPLEDEDDNQDYFQLN
ncbi:hypothetical protein ACTFIU_004010 [Dictyostelium citrinum]